MSKTSLLEAMRTFDLEQVREVLGKDPGLKDLRNEKGFDLLQICSLRSTAGDRVSAGRQLRLARWLVSQGFDARVTSTTRPGEDGEEEPAELSLVFFAIARAQNNALARYFISQGARPTGFFAAAWWGNWEILADLVDAGVDIDEVVGATPLFMAVDVLLRGTEGKPALARRRIKCLAEFLRLGADPNIRSVRGDTVLHLALAKGYDPSVFRLLLKHGADPDLPGRDGRTVRQIASRKRDRRYAAALR
jgi:hypothetical protein